MGDNSSAWDELFSIAAGAEKEVSQNEKSYGAETKRGGRVREGRECENSSDLHKKKGKKKKQGQKLQEDYRSEMLESRLSLYSCWPRWIGLGQSVLQGSSERRHTCSAWSSSPDTNKKSKCQETKVTEGLCNNCNLSPMYHSLKINLEGCKETSGAGAIPFLELFALVRDVRCCSGLMPSFETRYKDASCRTRKRQYHICENDVARAARDKARLILSLCRSSKSRLPSGEGDLLERKCAVLLRAGEEWYNKATWSASTSARVGSAVKEPIVGRDQCSHLLLFEERVRLIVACDAVYYRVYYLQITGEFPVVEFRSPCSSGGSVVNIAFIPHPLTYFGTPHLSWNVTAGEAFAKEFWCDQMNQISGNRGKRGISTEENPSDPSFPPHLRAIYMRYGVDRFFEQTLAGKEVEVQVSKKGDVGEAVMYGDHALACLHQYRLLETLLLFCKSGWAESDAATAKMVSALRSRNHCDSGGDFYSKHETIAPSVLMEWRDSSRDLLCNLYAYAALSPRALARIKAVLKKYGLSGGILELGAGTGYLARLLRSSGLEVMAADVAPTFLMNEYHGCTPPFSTVVKGDASTLSHFLTNSCGSEAHCRALLLCYPPPQSSMAFDVLRAYMSFEGRCLIHIGEFQGLTGSPEFEKLIAQNFRCVERTPCLEWGTDASELTIWLRKESSDASKKVEVEQSRLRSTVLIPCSNCKSAPAIKRCRLARSLAYCGSRCYNQHDALRRIQLAMSAVLCVGRSGCQLNFEDSRHFAVLELIDEKPRPLESGLDTNRNSEGVYRAKRRKKKRKHFGGVVAEPKSRSNQKY